jgi:hypothetical protein
MFVRQSARHRWRHGLVEERHGKVAEVEKAGFNPFSLAQLLKNPLSRLFGKPALARAADDYGNCHIILPVCHNRAPCFGR